MSKLTSSLALIFGFISGGASAWYLTKRKYENIIDAEVKSVKDAYKRKYSKELPEKKNEESLKPEDGALIEKSSIEVVKPNSNEYVDYCRLIDVESYKSDKSDDDEMTIISEDEFGNDEDYSSIEAHYYLEDGVLTDENGIKLDIAKTVGSSALELFETVPELSEVFVRNDILKCDYDIVLSNNSFDDEFEPKPD